MKTLLFIIGLISCSIYCVGQSKITGRIKDQQGYVPFVNVMLHQDSMIVKSAATDSLGNFTFDQVRSGRYRLSASMVGYKIYHSELAMMEGKNTISLPDILIEEDSYALDAIEITAEKQWLDQQPDRMIINLDGSITSAGNTILEVLHKTPGVVVNRQNNTIAVNGKSGVKIMINEKLLQVSADVAIQMLEGMSASTVDNIELILTPPANYDADGIGGIIHIVTKEQIDFGTQGSIALTLGAHWAETLNGAATVNHRNKNGAYFLDYSIIRNHNLHRLRLHRHTLFGDDLQLVQDSSRRENITIQQNLNAGAEWSLNEKMQVKILITGYKRNWQLDATGYNQSIHTNSVTKTSMNVEESNIWQSATGSIGLQQRVNAKSNVEVTLDYLFYHNHNPSNYDAAAENTDVGLSKNTPIHIFIGKADYRSNISSSLSWETGVKGVRSSLNNNVTVNRFYDGDWHADPTFTSNSTLREYVLAGYISAQWTTEKDWQINGGLRYEYTHTSIESENEKNLVQRKYGYLFPTLSLKKKFSPREELYFAYNRRLTRPTYNDIAPYVFFWGPNSFSAGNTSLYPALSDGVTAGYSFKPWVVSLQYTHTQKEITAMQPEIDSKGNLILRSQNLKNLNTIALTTSYSTSITPWWEIQSTIVTQYQTGKAMHSSNTITQFGLNISLMNVLKLPKDFSIEISGMYQSKTLSGISYFLPIGSLNAGIQKKIGQNGALKFAVDDILYTNMWKIKTHSPDNNMDVYFHYDWHNQFVRLTYTLNIGNTRIRSVKLKSASEEERQRVGN